MSDSPLPPTPQQMMKLNATALRTNAKKLHLPARHPKVWGKTTPKPKGLQTLLLKAKAALKYPVPRIFRNAEGSARYTLQTDASNWGWGAVLLLEGKAVKEYKEQWNVTEGKWHITRREGVASARATTLVLNILRSGDHLHLQVDATSTKTTLEKGSRVKALNDPITKAAVQAAKQKVLVTVKQIGTKENRWADKLSRDPDHQNYSLHHRIYKSVLEHFDYKPTVDLFASRRNAKCARYCSRIQDSQSLGDFFKIDWKQEKGYANPPWKVMEKVLKKIQRDRAVLLLVCPVWKTAHWWRAFTLMQRTPMITISRQQIFSDPRSNKLPSPRWATAFAMVGWSPHLS